MTGDHVPWFDHTILLVSDTFRKNPRQEKIKIQFFSAAVIFQKWPSLLAWRACQT
jgi:hypothetical protein